MEDKIKELEEKLLCKEQECEELKSELELYKTWYRAKHGDVKNILKRYHKALEEIEDIVQNHIINDFSNWNIGEISDDIVADYVVANCKQVLNIINKVKEG